jgi:hypothetical protein
MDWSKFRIFGKSPPGTPREKHPAPQGRESSSSESFGRTVTEVLPEHLKGAERPAQESFLSKFDSLTVKCNKLFGEVTIELPKGTDPDLAEQLAELVCCELRELIGKLPKIEVTKSSIRIHGIKEGVESTARHLAAQFLDRLITQCRYLGITDEDRFTSLIRCSHLPFALGSGSLDFSAQTLNPEDNALFDCIVDALRLQIPQIAMTFNQLKIILHELESERERGRYGELPAIVTSAAWAAKHDGQETFLLELIPIVGKVNPEGGLDLLAGFYRRYPAHAALPFALLSKEEKRKLRKRIASRAIRLALNDRNYLEAGKLLAQARRQKLAPSFHLNDEEQELVRQSGADLDKMGGGTACDRLILMLCAPKLRLLETAWSVYKADVRAGGRPAGECTQALFQSFHKDLLPEEKSNALERKRTARQWGVRFIKLARNAAENNNFKRVSRYMEFVRVLSISERDLLDKDQLAALVDLLVEFPNLLKLTKLVRLIREKLRIEHEEQLISKLAKAETAARFGAQLLGTDNWGHGISFQTTDPDAPTAYNSFDHALAAIKLAEDRLQDPDLKWAEAVDQAKEILTYVITRAQADTKERSIPSKQLVAAIMQALTEVVANAEKSPFEPLAARGSELRKFLKDSEELTRLLVHAYRDELPGQPDI